jgi:hypothetical protein
MMPGAEAPETMVDPERDDAPTTPPPAQRPGLLDAPLSGTRADGKPGDTELNATQPSGRDPDTLMSLPRPTPHQDLPSEARFSELEDRLSALEARLTVVERKSDSLSGGRATPWWFWPLFLAGLAITWQLLALLR